MSSPTTGRWVDVREVRYGQKEATILRKQAEALLRGVQTRDFRALDVKRHSEATQKGGRSALGQRIYGVYTTLNGNREFAFSDIGTLLMWHRIWHCEPRHRHFFYRPMCTVRGYWTKIPQRYRALDSKTGHRIALSMLMCMLKYAFSGRCVAP